MATIKAVMFDFDGVLFDTEPLHFEMFRQVLRMEGVTLAPDRYHARYVGLTDQACFRAVLTDSGWTAVPAETLDRLVQRKTGLMQEALRKTLPVLSGVREFVAAVTETCRTAIASGALRQEIALCLELAGITSMFEHVSAAQDVDVYKRQAQDGRARHRLMKNAVHCHSRERLMTLRCMDVNQGRTGTSLVARVGRPAFCRWSNPTGAPSELQESGNKKTAHG